MSVSRSFRLNIPMACITTDRVSKSVADMALLRDLYMTPISFGNHSVSGGQ